MANSQQAKAIDYLNGLRDKLLAAAPTAATAASSGSSSSAGSSENTAATAAVMPSSSDEAAAGSSSSSEQAAGSDASEAASTSDRVVPVDPVGVQLLLGEQNTPTAVSRICSRTPLCAHNIGCLSHHSLRPWTAAKASRLQRVFWRLQPAVLPLCYGA